MTHDQQLVATYGTCLICRAPRNGVLHVTDTEPVSAAYLLVCTADPKHGPDIAPPGFRPATDADHERLPR